MDFHGAFRDPAVHGQNLNASRRGPAEGLPEPGIGGVVGVEIPDGGHLDDEEDIGPVALLGCPQQAPQVLGPPLRGGVGESADPLVLQGDPLDLQKALPAVLHKGQVKPGIPVDGLPAEVLNFPQPSGTEPFPGGSVGGLGVHVDEKIPLLHGDQVELCFPGRVVGALAPDPCPRGQQLPAASCVLYMDNFRLPVDFHMGNEAVGPGKKNPGNHIGIKHGTCPFLICTGRAANWCLKNNAVIARPVRTLVVAIPRLEGKCIDNCPAKQGNLALFGGNRYLVPLNRGIATPVCGLVRNDSVIFDKH